MNLLAKLFRVYVPAKIKRRKLQSLLESTARAFAVEAPCVDNLSFACCLQKYAVFTRNEIENRLQAGEDMTAIRNTLFHHAHVLGREMRELLGVKNTNDVMSAGKSLYRAIGIEFEGDRAGNVEIHSCYFSQYYSSDVCRVMSALDEGIAAGLSGGRKLSFTRRITEGALTCRAFLQCGETTS